MQEKGYDVTGIKCSTKFQALKRTYKSVVDHNNTSGNNRKEWEYLKVQYFFKLILTKKMQMVLYVKFVMLIH